MGLTLLFSESNNFNLSGFNLCVKQCSLHKVLMFLPEEVNIYPVSLTVTVSVITVSVFFILLTLFSDE